MPSTAPVLPPPSSFTPSAHRAATLQQLQSNLSTSFALLLLEADNLLISSTSGLRVAGLNDLLIVDRQEGEYRLGSTHSVHSNITSSFLRKQRQHNPPTNPPSHDFRHYLPSPLLRLYPFSGLLNDLLRIGIRN